MIADLTGGNLIELWAKSGVVLIIGFLLIGCCLRSLSPAFRHRTWMFVMAALVVIPALLVSGFRWELIPAWSRAPSSVPISFEGGSELLSPGSDPVPAESSAAGPASTASGFTWQMVLVLVWGAGVFWLLTRSVLGGIWLARFHRSHEGGEFPERFQRRIDSIFRKLGPDRKVGLVVSEKISAPFTWGWLRPRVGLPLAAFDWSEDDLEMVLLHELEHVRRRDALAMLVSRAVLILNWVNPLSWLALRQVESCREAACDVRVLAAGYPSADYANLLFQQARSVPAPVRSWATAVAETGTLERRVKMILNTKSNTATFRPARTFSWLVGLPVLTLGLVIGIAGMAEPGVAQERKPIIPGLDKSETEQEKKPEGTVYRISVRPDETDGASGVVIQLNGQVIDYQKLEQRLSKKVESPSAVISAHEMTPAVEVVKIVDLLGKAGILKVKFASVGDSAPEPVADNALARRLKAIVIPHVEFFETPVMDALEFLSVRGSELSPGKKPVNIIVEGREQLEPIRISLNLKNVPLAEALFFTAELASARMKIEEHAVVVSPRKATDNDDPSPLVDRHANAAVAAKLGKIMVPKIEFVDAPIMDALDFLRHKAAELDADSPPEKKGVNFVLHVPEDYPGDFREMKITLKLTEVPLGEALKYTTSLAGLKYEVSNGAVVIGAK